MKDLQDIMTEKVQEYFQSGKVEGLIESSIESLFKEIVKDSFRSYGALGTATKELVQSRLKINPDEVDIASYNSVLLEALKGQIQNFTNKEALAGFNKVISETFGETTEPVYASAWLSPDISNEDKKTLIEILDRYDSRKPFISISLTKKDTAPVDFDGDISVVAF